MAKKDLGKPTNCGVRCKAKGTTHSLAHHFGHLRSPVTAERFAFHAGITEEQAAAELEWAEKSGWLRQAAELWSGGVVQFVGRL